MKFDNRDDILQITPFWTGERFDNGRPRVGDGVLRRIERITLEQAWGPLWRSGYRYQFEGDLRATHPSCIMGGAR